MSTAPVLALDAVQAAFNAGDVTALCQPDRLVDAAVIAGEDARPGGCQSELEALMANEPAMRLSVRSLTLRADLATATVATARATSVQVDLVRHGQRWLLSFSDGDDPMPALAGAP